MVHMGQKEYSGISLPYYFLEKFLFHHMKFRMVIKKIYKKNPDIFSKKHHQLIHAAQNQLHFCLTLACFMKPFTSISTNWNCMTSCKPIFSVYMKLEIQSLILSSTFLSFQNCYTQMPG